MITCNTTADITIFKFLFKNHQSVHSALERCRIFIVRYGLLFFRFAIEQVSYWECIQTFMQLKLYMLYCKYYNVYNVYKNPRCLLNNSKTVFKLMFLTLMLALHLCTIVFIVVQFTRLEKLARHKINRTNGFDFIFSFVNILDSKFVGLFMFVLANIITGLINLSTNTLLVSNNTALAVLQAYMFVVTLLSYCFYFVSISGKKTVW